MLVVQIQDTVKFGIAWKDSYGEEAVRKTILEPKAEEVQQRKRRKFVKRIDSHAKLKPFGFSVYECIDGFSRKLI